MADANFSITTEDTSLKSNCADDRAFDGYVLIELARSVNDLIFVALTDTANFCPKSDTLHNASAAVDRLLEMAAKRLEEGATV